MTDEERIEYENELKILKDAYLERLKNPESSISSNGVSISYASLDDHLKAIQNLEKLLLKPVKFHKMYFGNS